MAFKSAQKSRILLGDYSLSAKLNKVDLPTDTAMLDATTFADTAKRYVPGHSTSTVSLAGFHDVETETDLAAWTTQQPLTVGVEGIALGSPVFMVDSLRAKYDTGAAVGDIVGFDISGQADGVTAVGVSLHDLTAETATGNGTGHDQTTVSTTAGGIGHLHVTAFSGFTNIIVVIADSADNVSFATIGTFATVTGLTSERLAIAGTVRRYVRYTVTKTGTGSATFAVAFARL